MRDGVCQLLQSPRRRKAVAALQTYFALAQPDIEMLPAVGARADATRSALVALLAVTAEILCARVASVGFN